MRKTNKLLAVLLAALVALAGMAAPAAAEGETVLGVVNGSLDAVNAGNRPSDLTVEKSGETSVVWSSDAYRRGDSGYAVMLQCQDSADSTTIYAAMTGLEEGVLYTASLWFYVAEAPESGTGKLKLWSYAENKYDSDGSIVSGYPTVDELTISGTNADGEWYKLMHTFTCNTPSEPRLRIDMLGAGYTVYIDDISVEPETNQLRSSGRPTGQTVTTKDTGFELGLAAPRGWGVASGVTASVSTDSAEGSRALQLLATENGGSGLYFSSNYSVFDAGKTYKFSYSIKSADETEGHIVVFREYPSWKEGDTSKTATIWHPVTVTADWTRGSFVFQPNESMMTYKGSYVVYLNLRNSSTATMEAGKGIILDDVRIEEITNDNVFVNSAGFSVTEAAAGETVTARVTRVPAVAGTADSALYAVATYKRNEDGSVVVTDVKCEKVEITASDSYVTKEISVTMPTPEDTETYAIKSFVWDGALMPADALCTVTLAAE